jgi:hypothetical protein
MTDNSSQALEDARPGGADGARRRPECRPGAGALRREIGGTQREFFEIRNRLNSVA